MNIHLGKGKLENLTKINSPPSTSYKERVKAAY